MHGAERDVTTDVTWSASDASLGAFAAATFTSSVGHGGRTTVHAAMGTMSASTTLTLRTTERVVLVGTPSDTPTRFDAASTDASLSPSLVYPDDETMMPPNLGAMELHYRPAGASLVEIRFLTASIDLRVYMGCPEPAGDGCIYTPDDAVWARVRDTSRGLGEISWALRVLDAAGSASARVSRRRRSSTWRRASASGCSG